VDALQAMESMPPAEMSQTTSARSLNTAAHAAFVPIGIVTVLLGPLLPILSAHWSLNYLQAGSLFTAQFLGSTLGVVVSGVLVSRWGFRFAINAGLLAMALGVGALPSGPRLLGLICISFYGFGLGLAVPAINLFVAQVNPARRSAALSLLNFSWSVGAVACPFVVAAAVRVDHVQLFLLMLAGFLLLVFLGIAAVPFIFVAPAAPKQERPDSSLLRWNRRSLFVLAALFFLYVGTENGFGGWIASYAKSLGSSSPTLPVMTPSFFYAALMLGRWLAPFVLRKTGEIRAAQTGLSIACVGMAGLVLSRTMPLVVTSVSVAGLGLAAVYPITISRLSQEFGPAATRAGSIMFTMANLGGACLPWVVGYSSQRFNDLRAGLAVPLATTLLMYALYRGNPGSAGVQRQMGRLPEPLQ
jgi:FHS family glucose/mannose:H+ symporter-like MFS transporter